MHTLKDCIVLFTPPNGIVLDPLAGTMNTGLASIMAGRKCIMVEKDIDCYNIAFDRLYRFSNLYISKEAQSLQPPLKRCRRMTVRSSIETSNSDIDSSPNPFVTPDTQISKRSSVSQLRASGFTEIGSPSVIRRQLYPSSSTNSASVSEHSSIDAQNQETLPNHTTTCNYQFKIGGDVVLLQNGHEVGKARLKPPVDGDTSSFSKIYTQQLSIGF